MLTEQRRTQILREIQMSGIETTRALAVKFQVSEVTIRADLDVLADRRQLERVHGGAKAPTVESPAALFHERMEVNFQAKRRIARAAAELIEDNQTLVFDGGSTMMQLALHMPPASNIVIATNSMNIAQQLMSRTGMEVHMVGGKVDMQTVSTMGGFGGKDFEDFVAHKVFVSAHHIDDAFDVVDIVSDVALTKRRMMQLGRQVILLVDSSKWNKSGPVKAFPLSSVDIVITDSDMPASIRKKLYDASIEVIYA